MTLDVEQIKQDMEAGTPGPWYTFPLQGPRSQTNFARVYAADDDLRYIADCRDSMCFGDLTDNEANARRIARVPEMEARIIADAAEIAALKAKVKRCEALSFELDALSEIELTAANEQYANGYSDALAFCAERIRAALSAEGE